VKNIDVYTNLYSDPSLIIDSNAPDPTKTYLWSNTFLKAIGFQVHLFYKILICIVCMSAWMPGTVIGHCKHSEKHKGIYMPENALSNLESVVEEFGIIPDQQVPLPPFDGPPVEGLEIYPNGLVCTTSGCKYACRSQKAMDAHYYEKHPTTKISRPNRHRQADVQCFFTNTSTRYFSVNKTLIGLDPQSLYSVFLTKYLPSLPAPPMLPPNTTREIPPLLKMTGWHIHLGDFVTDSQKRKALVNTVARPKNKEPVFGQLHNWVWEYLVAIRDMARNDVPYTVLKYLLKYPASVSNF